MCSQNTGSWWIQEHITGCNSAEARGELLQEWCLGAVGSYITGLSHRPPAFCLFCPAPWNPACVSVWGLNCGYLRDQPSFPPSSRFFLFAPLCSRHFPRSVFWSTHTKTMFPLFLRVLAGSGHLHRIWARTCAVFIKALVDIVDLLSAGKNIHSTFPLFFL